MSVCDMRSDPSNVKPVFEDVYWSLAVARAALTDLLADPDEIFHAASARVVRKNAELYRRLA